MLIVKVSPGVLPIGEASSYAVGFASVAYIRLYPVLWAILRAGLFQVTCRRALSQSGKSFCVQFPSALAFGSGDDGFGDWLSVVEKMKKRARRDAHVAAGTVRPD